MRKHTKGYLGGQNIQYGSDLRTVTGTIVPVFYVELSTLLALLCSYGRPPNS